MIPHNSATHYRPEIDGLRAVAVVMALFFHAGVSAFSGGFVGADVFYVISGYLISGIVLREKAAGTFTFVGFYERRVRRIMPALLTMFTATALFALILLPADMVTYAKSLVSAVAFASNFYFWRSLGYFGIEPQYAPLLNTWSLAVEEQLYIVWPFVVVAVSARLSRRGMATFILAVAAAAVAFGLLVIDRIPYGGFFSPVIRSAEFLLGAFLAVDILPRLKSRWINEALAAAGLLLILSNLPRVHATPFFPRIEVLTACIGTALFIYSAGARDSLVTRLMATRPMVLMGQASYSLYLWHWPILAFGTYYILDESVVHGAKIALAFAAIPVAFLSWRYVEQPFRGRKSRFSRRAMFLGAAGVSAALALYGGVVIALHGLPGRFDETARRIIADDVKVHNPCNGQSARSVAERKLCKFGDPGARASIIVSGDSFSDMYYEALDGLARRHGAAGYLFSAAACRSYVLRPLEPADSKCVARNAEIRKLIRAMRPKAVVLIQRWSLAETARKAKANNDPRGARWLADLDTASTTWRGSRAMPAPRSTSSATWRTPTLP